MGPPSCEEGDGLRAGGGDWAFLGGCSRSLQLSRGIPLLGLLGGAVGSRGRGWGQAPRGLPAPLGSAERR